MRKKTLRLSYFDHLYSIIKQRRTYIKLCGLLHTIPFTWSVPNDDNRLEDGLSLRRNYVEDQGLDPIHMEVAYFLKEPCTVFEMLVALSQRLDFTMAEAGAQKEDASRWFFELLKNLEIDEYADNYAPEIMDVLPDAAEADVREKVRVMIARDYSRDGKGSLFPLKRKALQDFRTTEIWYQMMQYLAENYTY